MNFILGQNFKSLNKLITTGKLEEAEVKLRDISSSLSVADFIPGDSKYKKDALPLILQTCLPLTYHANLKLRLQAQSTLNHWSSLVSAFSPKVLLDVFQNFDVSTLQPEAHAAIFSFWANALRCVRPDFRLEYIGVLHSLLISSKADLLTNISKDIWSMLRETLTTSNILSILPILIDSPLDEQVSFLCEKSPNQLLTYTIMKGELQFIKKILPHWPNQLPIDLKVLSKRLLTALGGENSSEKSTAIEIVSIIIQRYNKKSVENKAEWENIFGACVKLWNTKATIAQKAAIIELFSKTEFIPKQNLEELVIFDENIPSPIRISIVKLCSVFIAEGKIPKGFFEMLEDQLRERDPLMYIAILEFFARSFNDLYKLVPKQATSLLERALTPIPRYFVEQVAVIKILRSINFTDNNYQINVSKILLKFLEEPHPSVVAEMKHLIEEKNLTIPFTQMDWIEGGPLLLEVVTKCDPSFISELIDASYVPPASYPAAVHAIIKNINKNDPSCVALFKRVLYVISKATQTLGFDHQMKLSNQYTREWGNFSDSFSEMVDVINDNLKDTSFGMIIASSLELLCATLDAVSLHFADIETLYTIAIELAPAFCEQCCSLVLCMHRQFNKSHHVGNKQKEKRMAELSAKFFKQPFPFDSAYTVTNTALSSLSADDLYKTISLYIEEAALRSGDILCMLQSNIPSGKVNIPVSPVFLKSQSMEYIKKCAETLPFNEWIITDDADSVLKKCNINGIKVSNVNDLTTQQRELIIKCPEVFVVEGEQVIDNKEDLVINVSVGLGIKDKAFLGFQEYKETEEKEPEFSCSFKPYPLQDTSLSSITQFLWMSNRKISEEQFKAVEESMLPFAKHTKNALALVGYAARHGFKIQAEKWAKGIEFNVHDEKSIILAALVIYLGADHECTEAERKMRADISSLLGLDYTDPFAFASKAANKFGARRFVAETIIYAEKKRFEEFPFTKFILQSNEFVEENLSELLGMCQQGEGEPPQPITSYALSFISRNIFQTIPPTPYYCDSIPPNIGVCNWVEKARIGVSKIQQDELSENTTKTLLDVFINHPEFLHWLGPVIGSINLTFEQHKSWVDKLWTLYNNGVCGLHPLTAFIAAQKQDSAFSNDLSQTLEVVPPSYTRNMLKALLNKHCTKADKKVTDKLVKKMPKVFIELLPSGGSKVKMEICNTNLSAFEEAAPFCDPLTPAMFKIAKNLLKTTETFSVIAINHYTTLPEYAFNGLFPDSDFKRYEALAHLILTSIRENWRFAHSAITAVKLLEKIVPPQRLLELISNEFYLTPPHVIPVYSLTRKIINDCFPDDKEAANKKAFETGNLSNEPVIKEALQCPDQEKALNMIIAHNYLD